MRMPLPKKLPKTFPEDTKFAVYAGLPLTERAGESLAWDLPDGRWFDYELFVSQGTRCDEAEFRRAFDRFIKPDFKYPEHELVVLPKKFPEGTEFADYEDTPVVSTDNLSWAWDRPGGRRFSNAVAFSRATICSEQEFRQLVDDINAKRMA